MEHIHLYIKKHIRATIVSILCLSTMFIAVQCDEPEIETTTTDDVVITGYLENNAGQFSEFLQILKRSNTYGFLSAYGVYTLFAPTNDAVQLYLQKQGVASVDDLSPEELKNLVRFHVIKDDTLSTTLFTDGKLIKPTMFGQYLTTGAINVNGTSYISVNRQAEIVRGNVHVVNGLIHVINQVLQPAALTLAQMLEQDPEYSIFLAAVKATGFYDQLNTIQTDEDGEPLWNTLVAQKDAVFAAAGFPDFASLEAHYRQPGYTADSLMLFIAYRIVPGIKYLGDLITAPSHSTLAPLEVITTKLVGEEVKINADVYLGVQEPGAVLNREASDFSATNGVLHSSKSNFMIKIRRPYPIYWDVCDQPELRLMANDFRKPIGKTINLAPGITKDLIWDGPSTGAVRYGTNVPTLGNSQGEYAYNDKLEVVLRNASDGNRTNWVEFTTPLIVRGKYQVWVCYRRQNNNDYQASFNGVPLPRIFGLNPSTGVPASPVTADEAAAAGWKLYSQGGKGEFVGRMVGLIDVQVTDRHKIRLTGLTNRGGNTGANLWLDMIHFVPLGTDQAYPRINMDGTLQPRP